MILANTTLEEFLVQAAKRKPEIIFQWPNGLQFYRKCIILTIQEMQISLHLPIELFHQIRGVLVKFEPKNT